MDIRTASGIVVATVLLLAWLSANSVTQKLSLLMLLSWVGSNALIVLLGFERQPIVNGAFTGVVGILVALLGIKHTSKVCLAVVSLFILEEAVDIAAFLYQFDGKRLQYVLLNGVFILRMMTVGGAACVGLAHRFDWRGVRLRHGLHSV